MYSTVFHPYRHDHIAAIFAAQCFRVAEAEAEWSTNYLQICPHLGQSGCLRFVPRNSVTGRHCHSDLRTICVFRATSISARVICTGAITIVRQVEIGLRKQSVNFIISRSDSLFTVY